MIEPPLAPTSPPTTLFEPVLTTAPDAKDNEMELNPSPMPIPPTSPPRTLFAPPVTVPLAEVAEKTPSPAPARPPAKLASPTGTLPMANEDKTVALLLWPGPTVPPVQLHL